MMRSIGQHTAVLFTLVLVVGASASLAQSMKGTSLSQVGDALAQAKGMVEDVEVIVQHNDNRSPAHTVHTFRNFSPTRTQVNGDSVVIEGSATEQPWQHVADITITLRTPLQQGNMGDESGGKAEWEGHNKWDRWEGFTPLRPGSSQ